MTRRRRHRSFSFIEVIASTTILAITIVPATQYLADSLTVRRRLERDRHMVVHAIAIIERQMAAINGGFTTANQSGSLAADGYPDLAFQIVRTDVAAAGGVPGLVMSISVKVWNDVDADLVHDAGERSVELHTLMARSLEP